MQGREAFWKVGEGRDGIWEVKNEEEGKGEGERAG